MLALELHRCTVVDALAGTLSRESSVRHSLLVACYKLVQAVASLSLQVQEQLIEIRLSNCGLKEIFFLFYFGPFLIERICSRIADCCIALFFSVNST